MNKPLNNTRPATEGAKPKVILSSAQYRGQFDLAKQFPGISAAESNQMLGVRHRERVRHNFHE